VRDLLKHPVWEKSELGFPLPESKHAVSVALPTWKDVIAYEEKDPECINHLKAIYPRFGLNPLLKILEKEILSQNSLTKHMAWPYSNSYLALKAKKYCDKNTNTKNSFIKNQRNMVFLITTGEACKFAKIFWQHTGLGASSREAEISLDLANAPNQTLVENSYSQIIKRISKYTNSKSDEIYLTSSGMSALHTALEIIYKVFPKRPTLQIGFPYVDVLKLPKNIFYGANLIIEDNYDDLEEEIKKNNPSALIIELPSNPMLKCANIKKISKISKKLNIPIITDDTIASNVNIESLEYSDIIFSSLTKIFSGSGDILAGSLIINSKSKWFNELKNALKDIDLPKLSDGDIVSLEKESRDFENRVTRQNKSCLYLKHKLENHRSIKHIFHPENCPNFNSIIRSGGGYGCLFSIEFKGGIEKAKKFYDSIKISKGPSLGNKFTLVCPYVQLAHYRELDWAESFGVPSHLIRVSVGIENKDYLLNVFLDALDS
tara:strand:- start:17497 stop:18963 length:1467 start_codon:yes stop_codon:yes gene_type:complete